MKLLRVLFSGYKVCKVHKVIKLFGHKVCTFKLYKLSNFTNSHNQKSFRPKTDEQYNAERTAYRKEVDRILEKISKSGYESLTKSEKKFLSQTSKKKNW